MSLALLLAIAMEAATPDAGVPVETKVERVERLRHELRAAELAVVAERVNAQNAKKRREAQR